MTAHKLTDDYRLEQRVRRAVQAGLKEFSLIEPGDRVLVGLSGGKDSMALLELLGGLARRRDGAFCVEALHVRMGNVDYRTDVGYLAKFAADCGCGFYLREISFEADRNERRSPCFLCSWNRRKQLFEMAQELGCTKIALGHHRDDILRTALMNLTFAGSFATMPVKIRMRKFPVTIIRPLCRVDEADLRRWAEIHGYQPLVKTCPHDGEGNRRSIESVVDAMQRLCPEARYSLWHALEKDGKLVEL